MEQTVLNFVWLKMIARTDTTHAIVMDQFNVRRVSGTPTTTVVKVSFAYLLLKALCHDIRAIFSKLMSHVM